MKIATSYKVKISKAHSAFAKTTSLYREAVGYFLEIMLRHWDPLFAAVSNNNAAVSVAESLCWPTSKRPITKYNFAADISPDFCKFPSYLRRAAIAQAFGTARSYQSRLAQWEKSRKGREPGKPKVGRVFPAMYRDNMFKDAVGTAAKVKVFIRGTWDWLNVSLKKTDLDYISRHCAGRKMGVPTLRQRGKNWFLEFPFEEEVELHHTEIKEQTIMGVDLGINSACVCSCMRSDGTVLARRFLRLGSEKDSLKRALSAISTAQHQGARKTPRLWARAKGINDDIAVKTAQFIVDLAKEQGVHTIVMERLELRGKKRGRKKQRLHHWRAQYVQKMVTDKAHRLGMRVSFVCAWNTSRLAFDGSGEVIRDEKNHSLCTFAGVNGKAKKYNCDLSASYNIGARYFIREIFKSLGVTPGQHIAAKVPECVHRSTSTLSSLIRLNAELCSYEQQYCESNGAVPF